MERENENLELGYLMAKKQAQDALWWVENPAWVLTGNRELAVPNQCGLCARLEPLRAAERRRRFPCTCVMHSELGFIEKLV